MFCCDKTLNLFIYLFIYLFILNINCSDDTLRCEAMESIISTVDSMVTILFDFLSMQSKFFFLLTLSLWLAFFDVYMATDLIYSYFYL